ncbi:Lycopene beta cyclase, chloroplastic/chromoplastic [Datura stramonium]|uniref:Lycopene beta cyclase, chloroplastic/chromoplastic n=1 Tax=Datura stramonium TaxID=4076 RepID=A0ABS8V147_DATST|nr:Lycopene beta cyclase, chloroplastic/chromoplastic [Datura stramonium]
MDQRQHVGCMVLEEIPFEEMHTMWTVELKERNSRIPAFLYAISFSSNIIFLEETSLIVHPGMRMDDIQERMVARLSHLGIKGGALEEDEHCVIPMVDSSSTALREQYGSSIHQLYIYSTRS